MSSRKSAAEQAKEREQAELEERMKANQERKTVVSSLSSVGSKDKQISAKVNEEMYFLFSRINKLQGLSNNSALNLLINRYVRENKGILEEDI